MTLLIKIFCETPCKTWGKKCLFFKIVMFALLTRATGWQVQPVYQEKAIL